MPVPATANTPVADSIQATNPGVTYTFPSNVASAYFKNTDAANKVWFRFDGTLPGAADAVNQASLNPGDVINLTNASLLKISFITAAGKTAWISIAYEQAPS